MTAAVCLTGGQVLTPGGLERGDVAIADGLIAVSPAAESLRIDCEGLHVLPGIVDVHGDAFEMELFPRPGVGIAFPIAMGSVDRQLLANGITTAYHGLTVSWEPGARSLDAGRRFMAALPRLRPRLRADHRVQLRWETFAHHAAEDVSAWLGEEPAPALAFNDHTTSTLEKVQTGNHKKLGQWAERAGLTPAEYVAEVERVAACAPAVPAMMEKLAARCRETSAVMLSHDERTLAERAATRALGVEVCEFPQATAVAADAVAHGEHVILGGPNVIRGGSHNNALTAEDAIRGGLCTVLASDYYYPSLFHAAEHLVARGVLPLADAWRLVAENPAASMGLSDRGVIAPGRRADLAVIDCNGPWRLVHTIAGGRVTSFG